MYQSFLYTICYNKAVTITPLLAVFVYIIRECNKKTVQKQMLLHGFGCHNIASVTLTYATTSSN